MQELLELLDAEMKRKVVEMIRKSDSVIVVRVILEEKVLNVVNAYAPQVGGEKRQKEEFQKKQMKLSKDYKNLRIL